MLVDKKANQAKRLINSGLMNDKYRAIRLAAIVYFVKANWRQSVVGILLIIRALWQGVGHLREWRSVGLYGPE